MRSGAAVSAGDELPRVACPRGGSRPAIDPWCALGRRLVAVRLVAVAAVLALHEFFTMTRPLRPISLAGYAGLAGVLAAVQTSGLLWAVGALLATLALAFLLKGLGGTQGSATVAVGVTLLGTAWIGLGLGCVLLLRDVPEFGFVVALAVLLAIFADDTAAYFGGRALGRHKLAPAISPGKTWEGFVAGTAAAVFVVFVTLYRGSGCVPLHRRVAAPRPRRRICRPDGRSLRVDAQAGYGREGFRPTAGRSWRRAGPDRRASCSPSRRRTSRSVLAFLT